MQTLGKSPHRRAGEAGFTLTELMIYVIIALALIASVYQLVITQGRSYATQRELMDVRGSLRAASVLLSRELRQASAPNGDLYSIGPDGFAVRSVQATGIVCGEHVNLLRYGLWGTSGEFTATAGDSALMFAAGNTGPTDDSWRVVRIASLWDPVGGGVAKCFWGDPLAGKGKGSGSGTSTGSIGPIVPDLVVGVTGPVDGVYMGAPLLAFRRIEYGIYLDSGRWWLGRRVGGAATWEKLTGPLRAPGVGGGLGFVYYDSTGAVTATPTLVADVEIVIRGESFGKSRVVGGSPTPAFRVDTVRTRVSLRG